MLADKSQPYYRQVKNLLDELGIITQEYDQRVKTGNNLLHENKLTPAQITDYDKISKHFSILSNSVECMQLLSIAHDVWLKNEAAYWDKLNMLFPNNKIPEKLSIDQRQALFDYLSSVKQTVSDYKGAAKI